jgi:RHS repeat-associated protein
MRTSGQGYGLGDNARQKYAGMEGDDATGMAHTLWRQYDSRAGRWTAPDPYGGSMSVGDPQSFNRYSYVNNDPVNKVDPTGLMLSDIGVYQTEDAEQAKTLQRKSDAVFKKSINEDYAARHGGTVSYDDDGHASFTSNAFKILFGTSYSVTVSAAITGPIQSNSLQLPTDPNDLAMLDTLLGEASWPGNQSWDMDEYGEPAYSHPRHPNMKLTAGEVEGEMKYMIYTVDNRLHDWTQDRFTGWKDVIERDTKQFLGYKHGQNIKNLGSDPASIERAQMAIQAIKDYHASPLRSSPNLVRFYYWKSIIQDNDNDGRNAIMKRGRATRMAGTDFMISEKRY